MLSVEVLENLQGPQINRLHNRVSWHTPNFGRLAQTMNQNFNKMTFYEEHYFGNFVADGFSKEKIFLPDFLLINLLSDMPLKRHRALGPNPSTKRVKLRVSLLVKVKKFKKMFLQMESITSDWLKGAVARYFQDLLLPVIAYTKVGLELKHLYVLFRPILCIQPFLVFTAVNTKVTVHKYWIFMESPVKSTKFDSVSQRLIHFRNPC